MPLEREQLLGQAGEDRVGARRLGEPNREEADLRRRAWIDRAPERRREQLDAKARSEEGKARPNCSRDQPLLLAKPGKHVLAVTALRPANGDDPTDHLPAGRRLALSNLD